MATTWSIRLSMGLVVLMLAQSVSGLLFRDQYRDVEWIKATWRGNDWITLVIGVPVLVIGLAGAIRGSARATLLWLGSFASMAYNYGFYLFGAALNVFFPLYVAAVTVATASLVIGVANLDAAAFARHFRPTTPVRTVGGALMFIGIGLAAVWIGMWAAYVFGGRPTPVEPEAFKVVAALDLTLMAPALTAGGYLLCQRHPWGYVISGIASIQGALYLLVLSVNSAVAVWRGSVAAPGELPIWGTLLAVTATAAVTLLACVSDKSRS